MVLPELSKNSVPEVILEQTYLQHNKDLLQGEYQKAVE